MDGDGCADEHEPAASKRERRPPSCPDPDETLLSFLPVLPSFPSFYLNFASQNADNPERKGDSAVCLVLYMQYVCMYVQQCGV